MTTTRS